MNDLRTWRFKKRVGQWELSRRSGVWQSRISLIENGFAPKEAEKEKIAMALGVMISEIEWPRKGVTV